MRLESPLLLLAAVPIALVIAWGLARLRRRPPALRFPTLKHVREARPPLKGRLWWVPQGLTILGLAAGIVTLARPQVRPSSQRGRSIARCGSSPKRATRL